MAFEKVTEYLDHLVADEGVPGCDLAIWIDHRPVYRHFAGERAPDRPMDGTESYWLYSATKVITMTVAMQLIERGVLRLSDPVADYLPAYAHLTVRDGDALRPARTIMTIEHLMAMQGGLDYELNPEAQEVIARRGQAVTLPQIAEALASKPLHFDPGQGFRYSFCHDVLGAVMEVATGARLGELARRQVFEPLGISTLTFHPSQAEASRLAALYTLESGELRRVIRRKDAMFDLPNVDSGGGGLMGDVGGYIVLADALANGGVGANGARILSSASIDDMRRNRQSGPSMTDFLRVRHKRGYGYGLGVRTLIDPSVSKSPIGEFGWDGAAGAWVMMDPDHHLSAFYAQHVLNDNRAFYDHHPTLRDLIQAQARGA